MSYQITLQELEKTTAGNWLFLPEKFQGVLYIADDNRVVLPGTLFIAIEKGHNFIVDAINKGASAIICDQELSQDILDLCKRKEVACLKVQNSFNSFHLLAKKVRSKHLDLPIIGITGSCGKTTVKEIIANILEQKFNGNILKTKGNWNNHFGLPRMIFDIQEKTKIAVLEHGSNHNGEIAILAEISRPNIAIITNIGFAHIEFFGSQQNIAQEKGSIFHYLSQDGIAIFEENKEFSEYLRAQANGKKIFTFGFTPNADIQVIYHGENETGSKIELIWQQEKTSRIINWPFKGNHQALNAAAAAAAAFSLGITIDEICDAISKMHPIAMRMEEIIIDNITWINDAYNANPDSMKAGLTLLKENKEKKKIIVLGDMLELGDFAEKAHREILSFCQNNFPNDTIVAVGENMQKAAKEFAIKAFHNYEEAQPFITQQLAPNCLVYLKGSRSITLEKLIPAKS